MTKPKGDKTLKQEPVEEIIIPPENRDETLNKLRQLLKKWDTIKYLSYWTIQLYRNLSPKKWIEVNHLSRSQNIRFKASTLRSDSCEYSNAYIAAIGTKYLLADDANENDEIQKNVAFKNNAPFRLYSSTFQ